MKRVYISVDIEGITDVIDWNQTELGNGEHTAAARQMTEEAAAACRGALAAGADEVWVRDAHDSARNIDGSKLPKGVRLIRGWECTENSMMEEIDRGFDCAVCIGYHSMGGSDANPLAHTISHSKIAEIRLNGQAVSELELNTYIAAQYQVPVVFVSGDQGICDTAERTIPGVSTVAVKEGKGEAAINRHPQESIEMIEAGVKKAVEKITAKCPAFPDHFDLELCYREHASALKASRFPGARRSGPYSAAYSCDHLHDMLIARMFMMS